MLFWILAATATAIVCAALYFASAARPVNAATAELGGEAQETFRSRLKLIERDLREGRLSEADGTAAKAELAREVLRQKQEHNAATSAAQAPVGRGVVLASTAAVAALTFALYSMLGQPDLPAQPLLARAMPSTPALPNNMTLQEAVAQIEQQLTRTPDDVRGWQALGPAYLQLNRTQDAIRAYRRVVELSPPSADTQSDLAEVLMMAQGGDPAGEPLALFKSAAELDRAAPRPKFYLAAEATRTGNFPEAINLWQELVQLSTGGEPWLPAARRGLEVATAGLSGVAPPDAPAAGEALPAANPSPETAAPPTTAQQPQLTPDQDTQIRGMVAGLAERLTTEGGTIEDWTRLVRSWLVLGETERARAAYGIAVAAYPDAAVRTELDAIAQTAGLAAASSGEAP